MSADGLVLQVKERVSILDVLAMLGLEDSRKGPKVACPFHDDDHPSMHVYVDQDRWQCFVCDEGGDQLDLLQRAWGVPLVDVLHTLAQSKGIDVRQDWTPTKREPSMTDQVLRLAAKTHGEVLRSLQADYPESRGQDAWVPLVEAAFWHYDEIMRRFRNKELSAETCFELLLIWWKWMTGGGPSPADTTLLFRTIGDDRFWAAAKEVAKDREQAAEPGGRGRAAGEVPARRPRGQVPGPTRRRNLQPRRPGAA